MHYKIKYLFVHKLLLKVLEILTALQLVNICTKACTWSVASGILWTTADVFDFCHPQYQVVN
jgi:hypothetical protein